MLDELGSLLTQRSAQQFSENAPGILEQLNTRGVLRSSGTGEALAREQARLEQENQYNLAQTALGYGQANMDDIANMLGRQQGWQSAGLQARLGLEDAEAQKQLAITLAELSKPAEPKGKTSGEKWVQGINALSGGVQAGASAYTAGKQP